MRLLTKLRAHRQKKTDADAVIELITDEKPIADGDAGETNPDEGNTSDERVVETIAEEHNHA